MALQHIKNTLITDQELDLFLMVDRGYIIAQLLSEYPNTVAISRKNSTEINIIDQITQDSDAYYSVYLLVDPRDAVIIKLSYNL